MVLKMTLAITGVNVLVAVGIYFACWKWGHKLKIQKPILIDELASHEDMDQIRSSSTGRWYVAKPMEFSSMRTIFKRINHAYLILIGKARAYQYEVDRTPEVKK